MTIMTIKKAKWNSTFEMLKDLVLTMQNKSKVLQENSSFRSAFTRKAEKVRALIEELPLEDQRAMYVAYREWKKYLKIS